MRTPQTEAQTLALLRASLDRSSSIKVLDSGVPLSAIASVEIDASREHEESFERFARRVVGRRSLESWQRDAIRALVTGRARPSVKLSEADLMKLRAEWLKQWPEVARYFTKK